MFPPSCRWTLPSFFLWKGTSSNLYQVRLLVSFLIISVYLWVWMFCGKTHSCTCIILKVLLYSFSRISINYFLYALLSFVVIVIYHRVYVSFITSSGNFSYINLSFITHTHILRIPKYLRHKHLSVWVILNKCWGFSYESRKHQ